MDISESRCTVLTLSSVEFILRPTVSRPVRLGIGLPFGTHDQILSLSFLYWQLLCCSSRSTLSLRRGRDCNLQCSHWLVRSLRTNNHTLPSHLRLCSLFVASYDSQGLRWRYSNPPPIWNWLPKIMAYSKLSAIRRIKLCAQELYVTVSDIWLGKRYPVAPYWQEQVRRCKWEITDESV
jgi:hypothetical protein